MRRLRSNSSREEGGGHAPSSITTNFTFFRWAGQCSKYLSKCSSGSFLQGYLGGSPSHEPEGSLQVFDLSKAEWAMVEQGMEMPSIISGGCCALINNRLYVFGGWLAGARNADIHELDLLNYTWRKLDPKNPGEGPFLKDKAGMVAYGQEMLCVFGGYGYPSEKHVTAGGVYVGQKGATYDWDMESYHDICWMNELHLFHTEKCKTNLPRVSSPSTATVSFPGVWISPETSGTRPPACAAFSFTQVDCHRAVLFGGRQRAERVNQVHILDMENWVSQLLLSHIMWWSL